MDAADEIIDKIKKCLRLAGKTSESGERSAALGMARRLADANGIALETVDADGADARASHVTDDGVEAVQGPEAGYAHNILREHFGVVLMMYQVGRNSRLCRLSWFGTRLNIDIARHVWHILIRESRRAWSEKKRTFLKEARAITERLGLGILPASAFKTRLDKASFMAGFFYAIDRKLREHPLRNDLDAYEAERRAAERAFDKFRQHNEVRDRRRSGKADNAESIAEGMHSGSAVNLARPCENARAEAVALSV